MAAKESEERVCEICKFKDTNDFDYGEWKTSEDCTIHYFCALLSYSCVQNGADDEGIEGFLVPDIRHVKKAHTKSKCRYCQKNGASVRCVEPRCGTYFHVICGVKNKCLNIFDGNFSSYCHRHVKIEEKFQKHGNFWHCQICHETMGEYDPITSIPSCCDQGYFHKLCIQKHVRSAGYLAKCPACGNDPDGYRTFLRSRGIFCPDKDADWELSEEAFHSLLYVHNRCDVDDCLCPKGRGYVKNGGKWKIHRCQYCGSVGVHAHCREDGSNGPFSCKSCTERETVLVSVQTQSTNNNISTNTKDQSKYDEASSSDKGGDDEVLKLIPIDEPIYRNNVLNLVDDAVEPNGNPLKQHQNMAQNRLDMFFERANFDSKPPPPPWLF